MLFIVPTNTCFGLWCFLSDIEDYSNIYKIKWRAFQKPLAIFIDDIEKNIDLSKKQSDFLKKYEKPWTLIVNKDKVKNKQILEAISRLPNSDIYKKLAFRQVHNDIQEKLIKENGYFFLTSANKSWKKETKKINKLYKEFENDIKNFNIQVFWNENLNTKYEHSDIFEFVEVGCQEDARISDDINKMNQEDGKMSRWYQDDSLDLIYYRK